MSNGTVEIEYHANESDGLVGVRKLSKSEYLDKSGNVSNYKPNENRAQSIRNVRKSTKNMSRLVRNNFYGDPNELFVTLTYGAHHILLKKEWITRKQYLKANRDYIKRGDIEYKSIGDYCVERNYITQEQLDSVINEMGDSKVFYDNFRKFISRLRCAYGKDYGTIEYICVKQRQGSGNNYAWHGHLLLKFVDEEKTPEADISADLQQLWGLGFVDIKSVNEINGIASYMRNAKDETLQLYPSGVNIYSKSRGMTYPETQKMRYGLAREMVKGKEHVSTYLCEIVDQGTMACLNTYAIEQYQGGKPTLASVMDFINDYYRDIRESPEYQYCVSVEQYMDAMKSKYKHYYEPSAIGGDNS
jgi:hypothetical protein